MKQKILAIVEINKQNYKSKLLKNEFMKIFKNGIIK